MPLIEKYFSTHRSYFIAVATASNNIGAASLKEKEMVARLVCLFLVTYCFSKQFYVHYFEVFRYMTVYTYNNLFQFLVCSASWEIYFALN